MVAPRRDICQRSSSSVERCIALDERQRCRRATRRLGLVAGIPLGDEVLVYPSTVAGELRVLDRNGSFALVEFLDLGVCLRSRARHACSSCGGGAYRFRATMMSVARATAKVAKPNTRLDRDQSIGERQFLAATSSTSWWTRITRVLT